MELYLKYRAQFDPTHLRENGPKEICGHLRYRGDVTGNIYSFGEDPTEMNVLYEQALIFRNCMGHFKFLASVLNCLHYETNQQVKLLYEFLGLIGELLLQI